MTEWKTLSSLDQLDELTLQSLEKPFIIFKHSTTCSISSMAKMRMEDEMEELRGLPDIYYLDLHQYRNLSDAISKRFHVHHESPQLLVIRDKECVLDSSHLGITLQEVEEVLEVAS